MKPNLPFRLGSTSYVYPADILPNVRQLAPVVDDVELVLFEVDDGPNNLPTPDVIAELRELAAAHDLTYTVHLPLDLHLAADEDARRSPSIDKACRVIESTRSLNPPAYVVHLDGQEIAAGATPTALARWREQARRSLDIVGQEAGDLRLLAVENLENYDPAAFLPLVEQLPISLCIDVGHFLKNETDPLPFLAMHLDRATVLHLHGSQGGRDHRGLNLIPPEQLKDVLRVLLSSGYHGVLTLEVFTERHFFPGRELVISLMEELC
ncbi:MAG: sugar phosphate isomerase/epimerase [Anaerolineae bacterium]|nr:sugar phosphate isomerase/epimerase [Anaerolineae bacterium]